MIPLTFRRPAALLPLLLAGLLVGCAPTLPVVVQPVDCPLPTEALARRCDEPRVVADGISYADLIAIGIDDRNALRACARHDRYLTGVLQACQQAIKDYNDKLVEINQQISGKP